MSLLDSEVLKVNAYYVPIGVVTVRKAFEDAAAESGALLKHEHGWFTPMTLKEWMAIDVEEGEDFIGHENMHEIQKIKVPRVMMSVNFKRVEAKDPKCTSDNLYRRYGGKDAVTGKDLPRNKFSREHVVPRSKGGKNGWENEVPMHKKLNSRRGNKTYAEAGLPEPKILPPPPRLLPINMVVNRNGYVEWDAFHIPRA